MSYVDVTDATFETEVIARSQTTPVVVDLWAPWCGPCRSLGPIIESVIEATAGEVVLVKVNVDENPSISQAFNVQSIPAVFALSQGRVVDAFVGAQGQAAVQEFVDKLRNLPVGSAASAPVNNVIGQLLEIGDEGSLLQVLDLDPGNPVAVVTLAELWVAGGRSEDALALLERIPEDADVRRVAALARVDMVDLNDGVDLQLDALLPNVKIDDEARQKFVDLLELMGPDDPRTATYRKKLTARLF